MNTSYGGRNRGLVISVFDGKFAFCIFNMYDLRIFNKASLPENIQTRLRRCVWISFDCDYGLDYLKNPKMCKPGFTTFIDENDKMLVNTLVVKRNMNKYPILSRRFNGLQKLCTHTLWSPDLGIVSGASTAEENEDASIGGNEFKDSADVFYTSRVELSFNVEKWKSLIEPNSTASLMACIEKKFIRTFRQQNDHEFLKLYGEMPWLLERTYIHLGCVSGFEFDKTSDNHLYCAKPFRGIIVKVEMQAGGKKAEKSSICSPLYGAINVKLNQMETQDVKLGQIYYFKTKIAEQVVIHATNLVLDEHPEENVYVDHRRPENETVAIRYEFTVPEDIADRSYLSFTRPLVGQIKITREHLEAAVKNMKEKMKNVFRIASGKTKSIEKIEDLGGIKLSCLFNMDDKFYWQPNVRTFECIR